MTNQISAKDLILNQYLGYRMADLQVEEVTQTERECNPAFSRVIRRDAMDRLEVIDYAKGIFMQAIENCTAAGVKFGDEVTLGDAIYMATGRTPDELAATGGVFDQAMEKVNKIVSKATSAAKGQLGKFGRWLSNMDKQA